MRHQNPSGICVDGSLRQWQSAVQHAAARHDAAGTGGECATGAWNSVAELRDTERWDIVGFGWPCRNDKTRPKSGLGAACILASKGRGVASYWHFARSSLAARIASSKSDNLNFILTLSGRT